MGNWTDYISDPAYQKRANQDAQPHSTAEEMGMTAGPLLGFLIPGAGEEEITMEGIEAVEGFETFAAFKRAYGPAADGFQWHHIVEQTPGNLARFGPQAIHNIDNLIQVQTDLHIGKGSISALYSSKQAAAGGLVVRKWLAPQSFEAQRDFGLQVLEQYGIKIRP